MLVETVEERGSQNNRCFFRDVQVLYFHKVSRMLKYRYTLRNIDNLLVKHDSVYPKVRVKVDVAWRNMYKHVECIFLASLEDNNYIFQVWFRVRCNSFGEEAKEKKGFEKMKSKLVIE